MGSLFGKHKKVVSRVTEQDKAVLQLKQQRDKLKQYQKKIEINLERDRQLAKKLLAENKRERAKLLLRKKIYQEKLLQNTDTQLDKLEQLTHDLEFAQIEIQVGLYIYLVFYLRNHSVWDLNILMALFKNELIYYSNK